MHAMGQLERQLIDIVRADPDLMRILAGLRHLALPDSWLVSGAIYQTVWNCLTGRPRRTGIKDYDLIYFDAADLSWEAEDHQILRAEAHFADTGLPVELRNQARVHLWFEARFGTPHGPALTSSLQSLDRYASKVHAVAIAPSPIAFDLDAAGGDAVIVRAPFGLDDLFAMRIRPNRAIDNRATHAAKAARMRAIWPELTVEPW